MRRRLYLAGLGASLWFLLMACAKADDANPPGASETLPVATSATATGRTAFASEGMITISDPLDDCLAGTRAATCVPGRDIETVTLDVDDTNLSLDIATSGLDWAKDSAYLGYLLFDVDKDAATGDVDIAAQYALGADVILLVRSEDEQVTLSLLGSQDARPLLPEYVTADDAGTLRIRLPVRFVGSGNFEFAMFILGSDAVKDQFPNSARVDLPTGVIVPNP